MMTVSVGLIKEVRSNIASETSAAILSEVRRQVQRGLYAITNYNIEVQYTLSAKHLSLQSLVSQWDAHLKSQSLELYDNTGYSPDKTTFVGRERYSDKTSSVTRLAIEEGSELFPKLSTKEYSTLFPTLHLLVLGPKAPAAASIAAELLEYNAEERFSDMSLHIPLSLATYKGSSNDKVTVRLWYDLRDNTIDVEGTINGAVATWDTGAIVSLVDLPGREVALVGLRSDDVVSVNSLKLTADPGSGRFWAGHKEISKDDLLITNVGNKFIAAYRLRNEDFKALRSTEQKTRESNPP